MNRAVKMIQPVQGYRTGTYNWRALMIPIVCFSLICLSANASQISPFGTESDAKTNSMEATLQGYGIESSVEGIRNYLKSLLPSPESSRKTRELISLLSHSKFDVRENATQELMLLSSFDAKLTTDALTASDPETAFRVKAVIEFRKSGASELQKSVFDYVAATEMKGLLEDIILVRERILDDTSRKLAYRALETTVTKDDFPLLEKEFLAHKRTSGEFAKSCLRGLQRLNPDNTTQIILSIRDEELDEFVKLEAAEILATNKNSECLNWFVSLLNAENRTCRSRSFFQLKQMTSERLDYSVMAEGETLEASISKWKDFVSKSKDEIEIQFQPRGQRLGRMLICSYSSGEIHSYDENGELRWSANGSNAFTCQGLPNGNCLVMLYSEGTLREYDENGKLLKELKNLPRNTSGIHRLENGNTILACGQSGNKIIEIDGDGKEVWSVKVDGMPTGARLLESGLIVAAMFDQRKIMVIDRKGVVQNEFNVKGQAYTVNVTANETYLVAFSDGGVAEYTVEGKEIWRAATASNTYWAEKLEDGTVITADSSGVLKIDQDGKSTIVNEKFKNYTYVSYY